MNLLNIVYTLGNAEIEPPFRGAPIPAHVRHCDRPMRSSVGKLHSAKLTGELNECLTKLYIDRGFWWKEGVLSGSAPFLDFSRISSTTGESLIFRLLLERCLLSSLDWEFRKVDKSL